MRSVGDVVDRLAANRLPYAHPNSQVCPLVVSPAWACRQSMGQLFDILATQAEGRPLQRIAVALKTWRGLLSLHLLRASLSYVFAPVQLTVTLV